jgi:hypothetical protein
VAGGFRRNAILHGDSPSVPPFASGAFWPRFPPGIKA